MVMTQHRHCDEVVGWPQGEGPLPVNQTQLANGRPEVWRLVGSTTCRAPHSWDQAEGQCLCPMRVRRLYLISPVVGRGFGEGRGRECRWRQQDPFSLMGIARTTPLSWATTIMNESLGVPDYATMVRPGLVGITALASQATRAYRLAAQFRDSGVLVVIGGMHATLCQNEVSKHADSVVVGHPARIWRALL